MELNDFLNSLPEDEKAAIKKRTRSQSKKMHLGMIREAVRVTQAEVAAKLGISQAAVSRLETRADILFSTLRKYIGAAGGTVSVKVTFPAFKYEFEDLAEAFVQPSSLNIMAVATPRVEYTTSDTETGVDVAVWANNITAIHRAVRGVGGSCSNDPQETYASASSAAA